MIAAGWFIAGLLLWSFLEFAVHRWIGHGLNTRLKRRHYQHHNDPLDYRWEPAWTMIGFLLIGVGAEVSGDVFLVSLGLLGGLEVYELTHYAIHRWPSLPLARHHEIHHTDLHANFAVTNPLWDKIMGTQYDGN